MLGFVHELQRKLAMATHIDLDPELLEEAVALGGFATKKAAVNAALAEYIRASKRQQLLALRGKVAWAGDLDALRERRAAGSTPGARRGRK
jgi:Arc/MetJ family transcription regulator